MPVRTGQFRLNLTVVLLLLYMIMQGVLRKTKLVVVHYSPLLKNHVCHVSQKTDR
jgi:hypothetical protein